jgi:hypothetical protein
VSLSIGLLDIHSLTSAVLLFFGLAIILYVLIKIIKNSEMKEKIVKYFKIVMIALFLPNVAVILIKILAPNISLQTIFYSNAYIISVLVMLFISYIFYDTIIDKYNE